MKQGIEGSFPWGRAKKRNAPDKLRAPIRCLHKPVPAGLAQLPFRSAKPVDIAKGAVEEIAYLCALVFGRLKTPNNNANRFTRWHGHVTHAQEDQVWPPCLHLSGLKCGGEGGKLPEQVVSHRLMMPPATPRRLRIGARTMSHSQRSGMLKQRRI